MYSLGLKQFLNLTREGNLIPVYKEINADLDTPVSLFLKLKKSNFAFLLESVEGQEKVARYSFLGTNPSFVFKSKGRDIEIISLTGKRKYFVTDTTPLDEIKKIMSAFRPVKVRDLPRFYGGLVGYMSYDMVRFFEDIPDKNPDDLNVPDSVFMLTDNILIFDHIKHTVKIVVNLMLGDRKFSRQEKAKAYLNAIKKIDAIEKELLRNLPYKQMNPGNSPQRIKLEANFTKSQFQRNVMKAKEYIKKGDIIQVVPSQRFKINIKRRPLEIYRNLRTLNPSPYMFFLHLKDIFLIGSSPEMLVRCENGVIQTRPIAGTRRRGENEEEDARLAEELINDKKERAEHIMLVDLGRNDLGRVSRPGTVTVSEFMSIEKYSHVMHLVSEVRGELDCNKDIYDVLRSVFPAGTVSGSPKIRAMEIIDELENVKRGPYAGCVGYFSFSQNMDACITIRTIVVKGKYAYVQSGAGIVADSIPEKEYQESVNKAKALLEAITGGCRVVMSKNPFR
ncbi:MAG: anthranilate synthase component I [Candidatus Omnitrophica bacterium]|nr:anthranilate synthase component I [Candidatus Omnitrophota bacterium]